MLIIARISVWWVLARMLLSHSPIAIDGLIYVFCDSSFLVKDQFSYNMRPSLYIRYLRLRQKIWFYLRPIQ